MNTYRLISTNRKLINQAFGSELNIQDTHRVYLLNATYPNSFRLSS